MKPFFTYFLTVAVWITVPLARASQTWNVVDAGAIPDGSADATAVFQRLLDEAGKAGGGVVEVPAGQFRINGNLSIPANVTLQGTYRVPPTPKLDKTGKLTGSVLLAYSGRGNAEGPPFIRLADCNAALAGVMITYPEWKRSDVPPVPYPPCIKSENTDNVGVRDCCLLNPYEAIVFVRAARHLVRNVTGYPSKRGIFVDECYDIGHIENVHFWPFGVAYSPKDPYCEWINTQGVAFELARTDWHYIHNTFCFGYGVGYKFSESKRGSANGNFLGLGADSCRRAVLVEQAQPPGLLITNGEFVGRWSSTDSVCLEIGPNVKGKVSLMNCSFWGPIDRCVSMKAPEGQFTASACHFVHWDNGGIDSPAIHLEAGKAIVQACTFEQEGLNVRVEPKTRSAILMGNQAAAGFRVENAAGARTQVGLNEVDSIAWTADARDHYRIEVGAVGDGRYVRSWHGREGQEKPFRWSLGQSFVTLPVNPGKEYTVALELTAHPQAVESESGLYLDGKKLAPLKPGNILQAQLPPGSSNEVRLELRCKAWVPCELNKASQDPRTLGIQVFRVTVKAAGAGAKIFNANTGEWAS